MREKRETTIVKTLRRRSTQFPHKLQEMLKTEKHSDTISWSEDGKEVIIKNKDNLKNILPLYFKTDQISSFNRQLNIFGFRHSRNSLNQVVRTNPNFTMNKNNLNILRREITLSLFDKHEQLKKDLTLIQIQQQQLQQQIFLLMQIQSKIQKLTYSLLKTYIEDAVRIHTRRSLHARYLISQGLSRKEGFGKQKNDIQASDVLNSHREFIESCLEEQFMISSQVITPQRLF